MHTVFHTVILEQSSSHFMQHLVLESIEFTDLHINATHRNRHRSLNKSRTVIENCKWKFHYSGEEEECVHTDVNLSVFASFLFPISFPSSDPFLSFPSEICLLPPITTSLRNSSSSPYSVIPISFLSITRTFSSHRDYICLRNLGSRF